MSKFLHADDADDADADRAMTISWQYPDIFFENSQAKKRKFLKIEAYKIIIIIVLIM